MADYFELLKTRRSIRDFEDKNVPLDIIRDIIRDLQADGGAKIGDIALKSIDWDISSEQLERTMKQMKREGAIFEPKNGYYRCT